MRQPAEDHARAFGSAFLAGLAPEEGVSAGACDLLLTMRLWRQRSQPVARDSAYSCGFRGSEGTVPCHLLLPRFPGPFPSVTPEDGRLRLRTWRQAASKWRDVTPSLNSKRSPSTPLRSGKRLARRGGLLLGVRRLLEIGRAPQQEPVGVPQPLGEIGHWREMNDGSSGSSTCPGRRREAKAALASSPAGLRLTRLRSISCRGMPLHEESHPGQARHRDEPLRVQRLRRS